MKSSTLVFEYVVINYTRLNLGYFKFEKPLIIVSANVSWSQRHAEMLSIMLR